MQNDNNNQDSIKNHLDSFRNKVKNFLSPDKPSDVLIIKANLICEYYLNQVLILVDAFTMDEIKRSGFHHKISKLKDFKSNLKSFQDGKKVADRLLRLNKLRNKVGHELEYNLSESDIDELGMFGGKNYIINKYNFDSKEGLLRDILIDISAEISIFLYDIIEEIKNSNQQGIK